MSQVVAPRRARLLGTELNPVAALGPACALIASLIAYGTMRFAAERARVRSEA